MKISVLTRLSFKVLTFGIQLVGGSLAHAHGIDHNLPECAEILLSRPEQNLLPTERATILFEINGAISQLRKELRDRPKARPYPVYPEFPELDVNNEKQLVADLKVWKAESRKFRRELRQMSPEDSHTNAISWKIDGLEKLAHLIGSDQLQTEIQAFQIVGESNIQNYLELMSSGACLKTFDPTLRKVRASGESRFARFFETADVWMRRRWARLRNRSDFKCEILFPRREAVHLVRDLNTYWNDGAPFSKAYVTKWLNGFGRDFLNAFSPAPDLSELGWNGREQAEAFLTRRRFEVMEEQIRFSADTMLGTHLDDDRWVELQAERLNYDLNLHFDWIPGWFSEADGTLRPLLTVITQIQRREPSTGSRRRRRAEAEAPVSEPWAAGGLVPAR